MPPQTEAACLLDSGVLYGKRLLLRPDGGVAIFAGFKPGAFSLYFGDAPIFHFDREGRWQRAYVDGIHVLKGLDNSVQAIDRVREGENLVLKRRTYTASETSAFDDRVRLTAKELLALIDSGRCDSVGPPSRGQPIAIEVLRETLLRIIEWDESAWHAHSEKYRNAYGALSFLPPDCPSPLILQATLGVKQGRAFGGGRSSDHRIRSPLEFVQHVEDVSALLGRRVEQCKAVFLGGSDVLRLPVGEIISSLETVLRIFRVEPSVRRRHPDPSGETPFRLDGIHTFLDDFGKPMPDPIDWERFRSLGLIRVSLGIESGSNDVRQFYGKSWSNAALLEWAKAVKNAGIGISPIVLVGAGGRENTDAHETATAELINSLPLGPGDVVSLIDAAEIRTSRTLNGPESLGFTPLDASSCDAQRDELKSRFEPVRSGRKAKVVFYSLDKQGPA